MAEEAFRIAQEAHKRVEFEEVQHASHCDGGSKSSDAYGGCCSETTDTQASSPRRPLSDVGRLRAPHVRRRVNWSSIPFLWRNEISSRGS